jgi:hypothetical protein
LQLLFTDGGGNLDDEDGDRPLPETDVPDEAADMLRVVSRGGGADQKGVGVGIEAFANPAETVQGNWPAESFLNAGLNGTTEALVIGDQQ